MTVSQADGSTHFRYITILFLKFLSRRAHPPLFAQKATQTMSTAARTTAPVREPADEELDLFESLTDILAWAGVKGNPEVEYTQSGALLVAIAGDEFKTITAAEFASISSDDFE